MKYDKVIEAARIAHKEHWRVTSDESTGDKQASAVTVAWQNSVCSRSIQCEVPIQKNLNEKIDVVDLSTNTAYEMKASGKNAGHEFFKDIFKVIVYNRNHDRKLKRLVFLTERNGISRLDKGLGRAVIESAMEYNIEIILQEI